VAVDANRGIEHGANWDRAAPRFQGVSARRSTAVQYGLSALTLVLVIAPIAPVLYQSFIDRPLYEAGAQLTGGNYAMLVTDPQLPHVIWNTLLFAVLSTVLGTIFGVVSAILVGRTDMPFRSLLGSLLLWPIFVSSLIMAFGWIIVYGPAGYLSLYLKAALHIEPWNLYSIPGMALAAAVGLAPVTFLYCAGSAAMSEGALEDAARTCGAGPFRTLFKVTLPLLMPAILYSAVLSFTSALEMLAIPLVFGSPSNIDLFTTWLYSRGSASPHPEYGLVATVAVLLLVVIVALLWLQNRLLQNSRRFVTVGGKAGRVRQLQLGAFRWPVFAIMALYVLAFILVPTAALMLRAFVTVLSPLVPFWKFFTLTHVLAMVQGAANIRAIVNTIVVAAIGGAIGTLFVALIAIVIDRSDFRFRGALQYIALFPRAVPGIVAGMGFFYAMAMFPFLGWTRGTILILMLAYIMRYIPLAYGALSPILMQIGRELDSSARVVGADWWIGARRIVLPLMRPALFSAYALLFIHFVNEYTVAVYLFSPGSEVIGSVLVNAWDRGDTGLISAFASLQIIITIVFLAISRRLLGARIFG
jgi:iron(III) transport system permease protein